MQDYESAELQEQYLLFHYGTGDDILPWPDGPHGALDFPVRCVRELLQVDGPSALGRALDLGCAVGRRTLELSCFFDEVLGIDFSASFIRAAEDMRTNGRVEIKRIEEGTHTSPLVLSRAEHVYPNRVRFQQGDALEPDPAWGPFDAVCMFNLIDRVPEPARLLTQAAGLLKPNGQLLLTTPFTWMTEYTPRENWLGTGETDSAAELRRLLEPDFKCRIEIDLPFLIREHRRKYQWSMAYASAWVRS